MNKYEQLVSRENPGFRVEIRHSVKPYVGEEEILVPVHPARQLPAVRTLTNRQRTELKNLAQGRVIEPVVLWPKNVTAIKAGSY